MSSSVILGNENAIDIQFLSGFGITMDGNHIGRLDLIDQRRRRLLMKMDDVVLVKIPFFKKRWMKDLSKWVLALCTSK